MRPGTSRVRRAPAAGLEIALRGRLNSLPIADRERLLDRTGSEPAPRAAVAGIIADVRERGDEALLDLALRWDGVRLAALEVPRDALVAALAACGNEVRDALDQAAAAITRFHEAQRPGAIEIETAPGVRLRRIPEPVGSAGVYAPGGRAAYPSSVLMGVIPARVAGVREVVVCSPPGPNGLPAGPVLAACAIAGADRVFSLGGAGAVAALAFGTATVPRVDRVVGPGNAFVAEAKRQLNGVVGIDSPAGPSEVLIVADGTAMADLIARELIAQAEHDPDAAAVLVSTDADVLERVAAELERRVPDTPRHGIVSAALAARGALLLAQDLDEAIDFASDYAPEHLLLLVADPHGAAERVRAAGTIFLGPASSVVFGDYITGANHVLPTGRTARSFSGLGTHDFLRFVTTQEVSADAAADLARATATLAFSEGLPGHAAAVLAHARVPAGAAVCGLPPRTRAAYRQIEPYDPGRAPVAVDLSDNTNLFGVLDGIGASLAGIGPAVIARYPSVYANRFRQAVADHFGVAPENVTTGCGSDDVIDSAFRAFGEPGDRVAFPDPTFGMVPAFGRMNALTPVAVPLREDLGLDVEGLLRESAAVTYLCRPNNPTGHLFERSAMLRLIERAPGVVLVDEAYAEFAGETLIPDAVASDRALVLRTMSKAWGMAGLRIGIAVGPAGLVREVEKSRGPYKLNAVAEHLALEVLESGQDRVRASIAEMIENRTALGEALRARGLDPLPSSANFVLLRVPPGAGAASAVAAGLRRHGVGVRPFDCLAGLGHCIRVTVGPEPMMAAFLRALEQVLPTPERRA